MKIVIDIPEYNFERIRENYDALPEGSVVYAETYYIANGTPLPKGHGRLIDEQSVINSIANTNFWLSNDNWHELMKAISNTPTIIEADKAESEE